MILKYPIIVMDRENRQQSTTARLSLSVNLPHEFKGTHMSRFIEVLNSHRGELTMRTLPTILRELKERLDAESAHIEVHFPYFLERSAPVSGARALMDYECAFTGEMNGGTSDFVLGVRIPVTSLCPCSKAISEYGAHNQRGYVTVEVRSRPGEGTTPELVWIEELVEYAEVFGFRAACISLLKREDEASRDDAELTTNPPSSKMSFEMSRSDSKTMNGSSGLRYMRSIRRASTITMRSRRSSGLGIRKLRPLVLRHNGSFRFGKSAKLSEEFVRATRS